MSKMNCLHPSRLPLLPFLCLTLTVAVSGADATAPDREAIRRFRELTVFHSDKYDLARRLAGELTAAAAVGRRELWEDLASALGHYVLNDFSEAAAGFDAVLDKYPESFLGAQTRIFVIRWKGLVMGRSGAAREAIAILEELAREYKDNPHPLIRNETAWLELDRAELFMSGLNLTADQSLEIGLDSEEGVAICDRVIAEKEGDPDPEAARLIAAALFTKVGGGGDDEEVMGVLDNLIARFGDSGDPFLDQLAMKARLLKAMNLVAKREDYAAALGVLDELLAHPGDGFRPAALFTRAQALSLKAEYQTLSGAEQAARLTVDVLIEELPDRDEADILALTAVARIEKSHRLTNEKPRVVPTNPQLADLKAMLETMNDPRLGDMRTQLAGIASLRRSKSPFDEAIEMLDWVIDKCRDREEPELSLLAMRALFAKGELCGNRWGDYRSAALEAFDSAVELAGRPSHRGSSRSIMAYLRATALGRKGEILLNAGDCEEAIASYDRALAEPQSSEYPGSGKLVLKAMFGKSVAMGKNGEQAESLALLDEVIASAGESPEPEKREIAIDARLQKGLLLNRMGDQDAALETFVSLVADFGKDASPEVKETVRKSGRLVGKLRSRIAQPLQPESGGSSPVLMLLMAALAVAILIGRCFRED